MAQFILKRLATGVLVLLAVACITFTMLYASSENIARNILGEFATDDAVAQLTSELGLDQPLLTRLGAWLGSAVQGDFGQSWYTSEPVTQAIVNRLPVTLTLVLLAITLIAVVATALGVLAATRRGWVDRLVQTGAVVGDAIPAFVLAIVLVTFLAIELEWFPAISTIAPGAGPGPWVASLALPLLAMVINGVAGAAQQFRSAVIQQLDRDFVRTLRSRGIPEREVVLRHVLRSAAPTGLTSLSLQFISMVGGVVIIERVFNLPGIGYLAVLSTTRGDIPVVMGVVMYTVIMVILVNLLVDLANGWLNPKVRVS